MKIILALVFSSYASFAQAGLSCTNGLVEGVNDGYVGLNWDSNRLNVRYHESDFSVGADQLQVTDLGSGTDSFALLGDDIELTYSAEGVDYTQVKSLRVSYNGLSKKLFLVVITKGEWSFTQEVLTCN